MELLAYWDFNQPSTYGVAVDRYQGVVAHLEGGAVLEQADSNHSSVRFGTGAQCLVISDMSFLEGVTGADGMTVAFRIKQDSIRNSIAFWLENPALGNDSRAFSAHVPYGNGQVYFDTNGCCGPDQRISGLPPAGFNWNEWVRVILVKSTAGRKIYLNETEVATGPGNESLLEGFSRILIGNGPSLGSAIDGLIDDLVICAGVPANSLERTLLFNDQPFFAPPFDTDDDRLPDAWEKKMAGGDLTRLSGLYGNIVPNDYDKDGVRDADEYARGLDPLNPDTDGDFLPDGMEDNTEVVVGLGGVRHTGTSPHVADTDGDGVKDGEEVFRGSNPLDPGSKPDSTGPALVAWWNFDHYYLVGGDASTPFTADEVGGYPGRVTPGTGADILYGQGHSGIKLNGALNLTGKTLPADSEAQHMACRGAPWINFAAQSDSMTVSFWQKLNAYNASSAFWFLSPGSNGQERGFQAHIPYGNATLAYFDTAGCCDLSSRLTGNVPAIALNTWYHYVFVKNGPVKQIWINGVKVLEGAGAAPLPVDFSGLFVGSLYSGSSIDGLIDDFAVYAGALSPEEIGKLSSGQSPRQAIRDFRITEFVRPSPNSNALRLTYTSVSGLNYQLERSSGGGSDWEAVGAAQKATSPISIVDFVPESVFPKMLYRVREVNQ